MLTMTEIETVLDEMERTSDLLAGQIGALQVAVTVVLRSQTRETRARTHEVLNALAGAMIGNSDSDAYVEGFKDMSGWLEATFQTVLEECESRPRTDSS